MIGKCSNCEWFSYPEWEAETAHQLACKEAKSKCVKEDGSPDIKAWYDSDDYDRLEEDRREYIVCSNVRGGCSPAPDRRCQAFFPEMPTCAECRWFTTNNEGDEFVCHVAEETVDWDVSEGITDIGCDKFKPNGRG